MTDPLHISPRDQIKIREGWLARRASTGAAPSTMCLAKHTHKGAYWQVVCSCSREPGHAADYHEDASVPVRWPVEAVSPASFGREPIAAAMTAGVENDGDRGPRAARDPLYVLDQAADAARAKAVQRLMVAVAALSVDEVTALAWVAGELPGRKLRRKCEEATATGWCGSDVTKSPPAGRRTAEDGTRAALLAAWRQVVALVHGATSSASEDLRQRAREDVLADEAQRRAGGGR